MRSIDKTVPYAQCFCFMSAALGSLITIDAGTVHGLQVRQRDNSLKLDENA
jgi:hypothetical protein